MPRRVSPRCFGLVVGIVAVAAWLPVAANPPFRPSSATAEHRPAAPTAATQPPLRPTADPEGSERAAPPFAPEPTSTPWPDPPRPGQTAPLCPTTTLSLDPGRRSVVGHLGMVVSVDEEATLAGVEVLKRGGNAVDAAIAVAAALAVTHPSAGNLGGGGFALVRVAGGSTSALDFREVAPQSLQRPSFLDMIQKGGEGPGSVGIPGTVAGLLALKSRFGTRPIGELFERAITLAEKGHRVTAREAAAIGRAWPGLSSRPAGVRLFGNGRHGPMAAGSWAVRAELGATLRRIVERGRAGFYEGETAESIIRAVGPPNPISEEELRSYEAVFREPRVICYRGARVEIMPAPSAGGVALTEGLLMLEEADPLALRQVPAQYTHVLLEILRRAHVDRIYDVVDPDSLTAEERATSERRWLDPERWLKHHPIDPSRATPTEELVARHLAEGTESEQTTHLAVVDSQGMAVSLTTTLSSGFGSKVVTDTGIVLNNTVASFSGLGKNQPRAGQRTTSSMSPALLFDDTGLRLVLGTPGGDSIPSTLLQLVANLVDLGMPLDAAVDAARVHQSVLPPSVARYEPTRPLPATIRTALARMGHTVQPTKSPSMGHANTILLTARGAFGYADPREGGLARGPNPTSVGADANRRDATGRRSD